MFDFLKNALLRGLAILIPVSLDEYSLALTHFGLGLSDELRKRN